MNEHIQPIVDQAQQKRIVRDTLILQKVNAAHREAFKSKYPGQLEHILRLTAERLHQLLLNKPEHMGDPTTWACTATEIRELSESLTHLTNLLKDQQVGE